MRSRRDVLKIGCATLTVGLAGCSTDGGDGTESPDDDGTETDMPGTDMTGTDMTGTDMTDTPGEPDFNIGMIYALGGTGDESFSDAANAGINEAAEQFNIAFDDAGPQSSSDFNDFQTQFAESTDPDYDLIICLGFEHVSPLQENAETYSDQNWALLDSTLPESKPNVESWLYAANEGAYIAGEAAATLSSQEFSAGAGQTDPSETTLGFVGGAEAPPVQEFEAGFKAGMNSVNEDFELLTSYVGSFDDPGGVETAANSMIESGADVLLHGAGAGGSGLFQACQNDGRFAFGADARQSETASDFSNVILGSIIKGVDQSVVNAVERVVNGEFEGGQTFRLTAGEGGFEVPWGVDIGSEIPQDVKDQADETLQAIADEEIDVPSTP
jgi:basic membrane protein A